MNQAAGVEPADGGRGCSDSLSGRAGADLGAVFVVHICGARQVRVPCQFRCARNGSLTLRVMPGLAGLKGTETAGYPFGVLTRLILT